MTWLQGVSILVIGVMAALFANILVNDGLGHGAGLDTFLKGRGDPWQLFINQDLVSGLLLSQAWVIFRQKGARTIETMAWVWLAMWWGNIVLAGYILVAMQQSRGDQRLLLMGRQAGTLHRVWQPNVLAKIICATAALTAGALMVAGITRAQTAIAAAGYALALAPVVLGLALLASAPSRHTAAPSVA